MPRALSIDHARWIVENLLAGVAAEDLVTTLATQMPVARARREVSQIASSPLLAVCASLAGRAAQLELVAAIARAHARGEPAATEVERRTTPPAEEFYRHYWAAHRPVVLTDLTRRWPALRRWTPAFFHDELGGQTIEVMTNARRMERRRTRMRAFIDALGDTSDYMVAHNDTMKRRAFARLLDDVRAPATLFEPTRARATALWIGPAGTVTSLHHDTTNIKICQIHGRKRVELVSPQETALLAGGVDGFFSDLDLARRADSPHPAVRDLLVKTVVVAPGDALFIPAGWWHQVTSLDVSVSFSLLGFRRPNDFGWYRPGDTVGR